MTSTFSSLIVLCLWLQRCSSCFSNVGPKPATERCPDMKSFTGHLITTASVSNIDACQAQCRNVDYCHFAALVDDKYCELYYSADSTAAKRPGKSVVVTPRECPIGKAYNDEPLCVTNGEIKETKTFVDYQVCKTSLGSFTRANNRLLSRLYREISNTTNGNMFWCQACVTNSLALIYDGATGKTLEQLQQLVFEGNFRPLIRNGFKLATTRIEEANGEGVKVFLPNKLFVQEGIPLLDSYTSVMRDFYKTEPEKLDYADGQASADAINAWIKNVTRGGIDNVVSPSDLSAASALSLISAAYLDAKWETPFNPGRTWSAPFYIRKGKTVQVTMMTTTGDFKTQYLPAMKATALEMPYRGNQLAMVFILPDQDSRDWKSMEAKFADLVAEPIVFRESLRTFDVSIPKLNMSTRYDVRQHLQTLGLVDMFDQKSADFRGMAPNNGIYVSSIVQKAQLRVDEAGTVASAANVATFVMKSAKPLFNCNRPFIFLIRDNKSGMVIFAGRVMNPNQSQMD